MLITTTKNCRSTAKYILLLLVLVNSCTNNTKELKCATKDPVSECGNVKTVSQPQIFKSKCATCHRLQLDATGPALHNVLDRVPSEKWFDAFIRNQDSLIKINDEYTIGIENWSPVKYVHKFEEIDEEQLKLIKDYLSQE